MEHFSFEGGHYEMGVRRGRIFRNNKVTFPLHLDTFQREHGEKSEKILRDIFPEVCEEIRGVSEGAGVSYRELASWLLCMGCCMYNLEENIPVEIRGCTAFACSKDGAVIYGRNNDLPPCLRDGCKSEVYAPRGRNRFQITTSSFINGEEGLNEHGLAVAMTFVMTRPEKIRPGLNACFLVRYLLEKADHAEGAVRMLMGLPVSSNCNILIADKSGEMAVAECTPFTKRIRKAIDFGKNRIVCTVNSFTSDEMKPFDASGGNDYDSGKRYRTVMDSFFSHRNGDLIEMAERLLRGEYGFMCQYDDIPDFETVWSSVYDLSSLRIYRAEGDPRKKKFLTDDRLRDLIAGETP